MQAHIYIICFTDVLNDKPKRKILSKFVPHFAHKWKFIACQLCDEDYDIDNDTPKPDDEKCMDMMLYWLKDQNASYKELFDALNGCGLSGVVEDIKKKVYIAIYTNINSLRFVIDLSTYTGTHVRTHIACKK